MKKAVLVALVLLGAAVACVRIPPTRVLPTTISSVYIPMFENRSFEPGLEEELTRQVQEELMMDGRIDVKRRPYADAMLTGTIRRFMVNADHFSRDEFPLTSRMTIVADVALYDPMDLKRVKPLMTWEGVQAEYIYISDIRRVLETSPQDATRDAMRALAQQVVFRVINTPPDKQDKALTAPPVAPPAPPQRVLGGRTAPTPAPILPPPVETSPTLPAAQP